MSNTEALELRIKSLEGQLAVAKRQINTYNKITTESQKKLFDRLEAPHKMRRGGNRLGRNRIFNGYDPTTYNPMTDRKPEEYDVIDELRKDEE